MNLETCGAEAGLVMDAGPFKEHSIPNDILSHHHGLDCVKKVDQVGSWLCPEYYRSRMPT